MKKRYLLFLIIFASQCIYSQCPTGNIQLNSQQDVDDFIVNYPNCTEIQNSVSITNSDITDLTGLNNITNIEGNLLIRENNNLTTLNGLNNITNVEGFLSISENINLTNLNGLDSLTSIGSSLSLVNNDFLTDLTALNNITQIGGDLSIRRMDAITNLDFFNSLVSIGQFLFIDSNSALENINGLNSVTTIEGYIKIYKNDKLTSIAGLNLINSDIDWLDISKNSELTEIIGFNDLQTINGICYIKENPKLVTIDGFQNLQVINGEFGLTDNTILSSFTAFNNLTQINGNFTFQENESLIDFSNLSSLNSILGNFSVLNNGSLADFQGLQNLSTIQGDFIINYNNNLENFEGLQNLTAIPGNFNIRNNNSLKNFLGLQNLTSIQDDFTISYNNSLENLNGLGNLTEVNRLTISNNDNLLNTDGMNSIMTVGGSMFIYSNNALVSLNDLNSIQSINGSLYIGISFPGSYNPSLTSFPFQNLTTINGDLIITKNGGQIELSGFNSLQTINGFLEIDVNQAMTTISGFNSLETVNSSIEVRYNHSLQHITGFNSLNTIDGGLKIITNRELESVTGFQNLNTINNLLYIYECELLTDITGFSFLNTINGDLRIGNGSSATSENLVLESLSGLEALHTITGDLIINSNPSLLNVDALNSLTTIGERLIISGSSNDVNSLGNLVLENLDGFSALTNVKEIHIGSNAALSSINFSSLQVVDKMYIYKNPVLTNFVGLETLTQINGDLTIDGNQTLSNFQGLNNLEVIEGDLLIENNPNITNFQGLNTLEVIGDEFRASQNHNLTNFQGLNNLEVIEYLLNIRNNDNLTNLNGLEPLTNVILVDLNSNQELNDISALSNINHNNLTSLNISSNINLSVCSEVSVCNYLSINNSGHNIFNNNSGCNSKEEIIEACNTGFNIISGTITLDYDQNGCGVNDIITQDTMIIASDGVETYSTFSQTNGEYLIYTIEGDYSVSISTQLPNYYTSNPISQNSNFSGFGNTDIVDFCIEPIGAINDLNISVYPFENDPRPGFDTNYRIVYKNVGTTQLSGDVVFEFDDSKLNFLSASETIASQTSNTLTFNFTDLNPFETRTIDLEFNVFAPPTTNIDDVLVSKVTVNPVSGDETEEDNVFTLNQIVIGSYDPNDIRVLEGDKILLEDADKYLHYIIRFQNTGTASAINVNVENILDDRLDWTTMQLESLSHEGRVEIKDGSEVKFIFNDINLPDSTNDEPNSHGFIAYKIKPKNDAVVGDIFDNTADIFFDFNPAITTNTVNTEIVSSLSVSDYNLTGISIYPNPTNGELSIRSKSIINTIKVFDMNGRLLNSEQPSNSQLEHQLDVTNLSQGIYFLEIQSNDRKEMRKFIKK